MLPEAARSRRPAALARTGAPAFALLGLSVVAVAFVLGARLTQLDDPAALALGVTLDLTLGLPAAFYLLVVRPRGGSPARAIPVALLGLVLAAAALPPEHQAPVRVAERVVLPLELLLIGAVCARVRRAWRAAPPDATVDGVERFRRTAGEVLRSPRLADVLAGEVATVWFALFSWRRAPHVAPGTRAVSTHRRSSHGPLVLALLVLTAGEVTALHFLLALWSSTAAWVATALSLYGGAWLVADYRATALRPVLVGPDIVHVRAGLRGDVPLERGRILEVRAAEPVDVTPRLSLAFLARPNAWLVLAEPVVVTGPYGLRRPARAIGVSLDEDLDLDAPTIR